MLHSKITKPFITILLLIAPAFGSWYRGFAVRIGLASSRIPKFVLELNHPYIQDHGLRLENLDDPQQALCSSEPSTQETIPPPPDDLFRTLWLGYGGGLKDSDKWVHVEARLTEMKECPRALQTCQEAIVKIKGHEEMSLPVPNLFAEVLGSMTSLANITWTHASDGTGKGQLAAPIAAAFSEQQVLLPTVTSLKIHPGTHFLVESAPNLEVLSSTASYWHSDPNWNDAHGVPWHFQLVRSARGHDKLRAFSLESRWTDELIDAVIESMPTLQTFGMTGVFFPNRFSLEGDMTVAKRLQDYMNRLASLKHLKHLRLPGATEVGFYVPEGSDCGNAYFGPSGRKLGRHELIQHLSALEKISRIVMAELPHLEELEIGWTSCEVVDGDVKWPWAGRVREYLLESFSRAVHDDDDGPEDPDGPVFWTERQDEMWLGADPGDIDMVSFRGDHDDEDDERVIDEL